MTVDDVNREFDGAAERPCQFCGDRPATVHGFRVVAGFVSLCKPCFRHSIGLPLRRWSSAKPAPSRTPAPLFKNEADDAGTVADFPC